MLWTTAPWFHCFFASAIIFQRLSTESLPKPKSALQRPGCFPVWPLIQSVDTAGALLSLLCCPAIAFFWPVTLVK